MMGRKCGAALYITKKFIEERKRRLTIIPRENKYTRH